MAILRYILTQYEQPIENFFYILTDRWACLCHVTSGDVRKRTVIRRIFGFCRRVRVFRRRHIVGTLTNKANISF